LTEIALPTTIAEINIADDNAAPSSTALFRVDELIKRAKGLKWKLYTRGDYAVATAAPVKAATRNRGSALSFYLDHSTNVQSRSHVEFQQIDGHWKITQLIPALITGLYRTAAVSQPTPSFGSVPQYAVPQSFVPNVVAPPKVAPPQQYPNQ
jgi:hypothetical protein